MYIIIKDIEGDLFSGSTLHLDASGLVNGLRKMRDGHSFFGTIDKIVIKYKIG
jgi:hypothetical protein